MLARLDFEAVLVDFKAKLVEFARDDFKDAIKGVLDASVEGDPINALLETFAYFYMTKVAEENDKSKALMLPYAWGTTLDVLAYNLYGTSRLAGESDVELQDRAMLSWEALSTAGPYGAYQFHALSAHPKVKGVGVIGPETGLVLPGQVKIVVVSRDGDGTPSPGILASVDAYLNAKERRPLTDQVIVEAANPLQYTIEAVLKVAPGPDKESVRQAAIAQLKSFTETKHRVGSLVALSSILAKLTAEGVEQVILTSPLADVVPGPADAPFCAGITVWAEEADA